MSAVAVALNAGPRKGAGALASDEVSALALAYQRGERTVFDRLYQELRPLVLYCVARSTWPPARLPGALDRDDLEQQAWMSVTELAERWNPALGAFGAYVRASLPWMLSKYVQHHGPRRFSRTVVVIADEDAVQLHLEQTAGEDGRAWVDRLELQEMLAPLSDVERSAVTLHAAGYTFDDLAGRLGMSKPAAFRLHRKALGILQQS